MGEAQRDEIAKLEALYAANPEGRVFTHLAEAYRKAGNLDRAREILGEGLSRHPDSGTAYVVLGRVAYDSDRPEEARDAFGRALDLDGGNLVAHRYLGELALARGDRESARRHFEELLARNPTDESLLGRLRELSEPVFEGPPAGDAPALAEDARAEDGLVAEAEGEDSWTLPSEGFGDEPGAGDALPTLDLEPATDRRAGDLGADTTPWSWDAPSREPADFAGLDEFGTIEGLEGSDWDEAGAGAELPELEGLEPMPQFDASLDEGDAVEPATWLADEPEALEEEAFDLRGFEPEAEPLEPFEPLEQVPIDDSPTADWPTVDAPTVDAPGDEGGQAPWRPYAVGEEAVADAQAEAGAVEASAAWPSEPERAPGAGLLPGRPDDVMTETIAELYLTQGFPGRAADVYRSLLQRHPDDGRLQERLAEAERQATPAAADPGEGGEDWAGTADSAFTGGSSAVVGEATPYAWGSVAEESPAEPAAEQAAPIANYFQSLLRWRAGTAPGADAVAAVEEDASAAGTDTPLPEAELVLEPEAEVLPEPELILDEPASGTEDFGGWTPDMLLDPEPAAAPERMPWEATEPASLASAEDAAGGADFGSAGEGASPTDGAVSGAEPAAQETVAGEEPGEEDEDLEMFRTWLQSLKK